MKKKYLLLVTLLGFCFYLNAQTFNNRYIIDQTAMIFRSLVQTGDTIITMGLGSTFYAPNPSKLMFTKFNSEGEVLGYDVILGDSLIHYVPESSSLRERKLLSVGGAGVGLSNESGFYALYDLDNGLYWIKRFFNIDGWSIFFIDCLFLEDKILLLGNQQNYIDGGSIISSKLLCTNLQGEVLWEKNFGSENFNMPCKLITLSQDSTIYLGLEKFTFPFVLEWNPRSVIYELDLDGNLLSEWTNEENNTQAPEQIIETDDGGLLFVGRYFHSYYMSTGNVQVPFYQGNICKLDSLGSIDWSIKTGRPVFGTDMNNLIATMDGNYIAIGNTFDTLSGSGDYTESGHIIKFNIEGEIIWEKRYYGIDTEGEYNRPYDIVELPDSSLLLCGESVDVLGDFPYRGWLLKLDKNGNLEDPVSILSPQRPLPQENLLHIFPNPAKAKVKVTLEEEGAIEVIELFDVSGRVVATEHYEILNQGNVTFDIPSVAAGIYFVKVNQRYVKKIYVYE